jgi:DNA polymerase III subunit gamma/tau
VLREVDHLISEGHSPTHFARQMVRFLRNATVAKIAGKDSSLLQISSEERERVARVAELFGEEDLTRHLQIMLRTHGELGYKQEQRFHLELGLLKMAHAQRLLPMEQLLSEVAPSAGGSGVGALARPIAVAPGSGAQQRSRFAQEREDAAPSAASKHVSPFDADSARKGSPRQEYGSNSAPGSGPRMVPGGSPAARVVMGAAAPANLVEDAAEVELNSPAEPQREAKLQAAPPLPQVQAASIVPVPASERLRDAVLQALRDGNQRILVSMLEAGEWAVEGNEVVIKVSESQTVVDMSMGADARRLAVASASGVLGRAVKLRIVSGATVAAAEGKSNGNGGKSGGTNSGTGGRGRAEQDAVVRRLQEKFGAEIRTVIDYKEKR